MSMSSADASEEEPPQEKERPNEVFDLDALLDEDLDDDVDEEELARLLEGPLAKLAKMQSAALKSSFAFRLAEQAWVKDLTALKLTEQAWMKELKASFTVPEQTLKALAPITVPESLLAKDLTGFKTADLAWMTDSPAFKAAEAAEKDLTRFKLADPLGAKALASISEQLETDRRWFASLSEAVRGPSIPPELMKALQPQWDLQKLAMPSLALPEIEALSRLSERFSFLTKLPATVLPHDWFPKTWEDLSDEEEDVAMAIVRDEGIPLVWVARAEIVQELVRAPNLVVRDDILLTRRPDIVQDCLSALGEVADPDFKDLVDAAIEAAEALDAGRTRSAQALACNSFDTALRLVLRRGKIFEQGMLFEGEPVTLRNYKKFLERIKPVSDDTAAKWFRAACVFNPIVPAFESYNPGDPTPERFNRHSTAHHLDQVSYCPENAIVAVMLTASLLREAEASGW